MLFFLLELFFPNRIKAEIKTCVTKGSSSPQLSQLNKGTTITRDRTETSPGTEVDVEETANNSVLV